MCSNTLRQHIHGHEVVAALGDDYVRVALGGLNVHLMHGLDRGEVLVHDGFEAAAPVAHVADYSAEDALVGVRIDEDLDVQQLADRGSCRMSMPSTRTTGEGFTRTVLSERLWTV